MRRLLAAALLAAAAPSSGAAASAGIGLSAAPSRLTLVGAAHSSITLRNPGSRPLVVTVSSVGFALSERGRPRVGARRGAPGWLRLRPRRLDIPAGGSATLAVSTRPPRRAQPGDHPTLVLLTTQPVARARVRVRLRVGVVVVLHVPGRIVRRLEPLRLGARRRGNARLLELGLANRGNVTEELGTSVRIVLLRGGRPVATLRPQRRELLPRASGTAEFVYRGPLQGAVSARVELRPGATGAFVRSRRYRLRL